VSICVIWYTFEQYVFQRSWYYSGKNSWNVKNCKLVENADE